jgi:hypothetical protein
VCSQAAPVTYDILVTTRKEEGFRSYNGSDFLLKQSERALGEIGVPTHRWGRLPLDRGGDGWSQWTILARRKPEAGYTIM